jgi:hypothetical protein
MVWGEGKKKKELKLKIVGKKSNFSFGVLFDKLIFILQFI